MSKATLQAVDPATAPNTTQLDPFAPENLRLSQSFNETAGVKKLLTTVPVRKPGPQDFVRVHPKPEYRENFPIIELKDEREEYIVTAAVVSELPSTPRLTSRASCSSGRCGLRGRTART